MKLERIKTERIDGWIHMPPNDPSACVVLTHGAGGNCETALLVKIADRLGDAGMAILRCNLQFRQLRKFGPPGPRDGPADRASLECAGSVLRDRFGGPLILAGHSYGGRQASILAASKGDFADALLLLSYPLHPPNKPQQMRTDHFPNLQNPALFVQGSSDPFGSIAEMQHALELIPGRTGLSIIENAGHDLRRGAFEIETHIVAPLKELITSVLPS